MTGLSLRSVKRECERQSPPEGVLELDESYFGPRPTARARPGKPSSTGLLKRGGQVYTAIVPNAGKAALQAAIRGRACLGPVVHTDGWAGRRGLADPGFDKHLRAEHRDNIPARRLLHGGVERFRSLAKRRPARFRGAPQHAVTFT